MAFRKIVIRKPQPKEIEVLLASYTEELGRFKKDPSLARKLLKVGAYPQKETLDPLYCAALMHVVSIIYNLDETISKS
jgi:hypothetical protein